MYKLVIILHTLGATIWTGGHLILCLTYLPNALRTKKIDAILQFESRFETIGILALIIQVLTGLWLAFRYNPFITDWFKFNNVYSSTISLKIILLICTLLLAIDARMRILPKFNIQSINSLAWHIVLITIISVLFSSIGVTAKIGGLF